MTHTMHNIILPDGQQTMAGKPILADTHAVKGMIAFAKRGGYNRVIDLGAGEGGYAIAFAQAGFEVTAVEPRQDNIEKIKKVSLLLGVEIRVKEMTAEHYLRYVYDAIPPGTLVLCLGLLYHLPDPAAVLASIARKANGLILSTHYALHRHWQYDYATPLGSWLLKRICKRVPWLFRYTHYGLSRLTMLKGRWGRWYSEYPQGYKNVEALSHSSIHNHRSFWLTRKSIEGVCVTGGLTLTGTEERIKGQNFTGFYQRKK